MHKEQNVGHVLSDKEKDQLLKTLEFKRKYGQTLEVVIGIIISMLIVILSLIHIIFD